MSSISSEMISAILPPNRYQHQIRHKQSCRAIEISTHAKIQRPQCAKKLKSKSSVQRRVGQRERFKMAPLLKTDIKWDKFIVVDARRTLKCQKRWID